MTEFEIGFSKPVIYTNLRSTNNEYFFKISNVGLLYWSKFEFIYFYKYLLHESTFVLAAGDVITIKVEQLNSIVQVHRAGVIAECTILEK